MHCVLICNFHSDDLHLYDTKRCINAHSKADIIYCMVQKIKIGYAQKMQYLSMFPVMCRLLKHLGTQNARILVN